MLSTTLVSCRRFKNVNFMKIMSTRKPYATSTQPAIQNAQESYEKQLKDFETLSNITKKVRTKKPQKPPFAKNLFMGVFDRDILSYPELEKEYVENLEQNITPLEKLMTQKHMTDCDTLSNKYFRQNLSDYKAIGLQASQFLDGRECNVTESCRFLEVLSNHNLSDSIISNEQLGVQMLVRFSSDQLKKKYLNRLMKGDLLSAFCLSETALSDIHLIKTKATLSTDKKTWVLNGTKCRVVNGISADVFIVIALTEVVSRDFLKEAKLSAFVVDRNSPGISVQKIHNSGIEVADITFNDTVIPTENVIGEINNAEGYITSLINEFRLSMGPACVTLTKKMLNNLAKDILEQSNDTNILYKTDAIGGKIGEAAVKLYAMESVLYLTTGLIDNYENQDCMLESAIVKVFCSEHCIDTSIMSFDLLGAHAISDSHWVNETHKEALRYLTLYETNDGLKILVALLGLQYAGTQLNETVSKLRNPLFHGSFIMKRLWNNRRNREDNPKLDLELGDYLHPSLLMASEHLEYCVKRLQFATEIMLSRFGPEVISKHMDLRRLAECIIDIYTLTACVGRASRSYCIGLQNGDYEMLIANAFSVQVMERVKNNVNQIFVGDINTNDINYKEVAKKLFKFKRYFPKHPLTRNF